MNSESGKFSNTRNNGRLALLAFLLSFIRTFCNGLFSFWPNESQVLNYFTWSVVRYQNFNFTRKQMKFSTIYTRHLFFIGFMVHKTDLISTKDEKF